MVVNCDVVQGSVLGPLLLLIYFTDFPKEIWLCQVHHFADDTNPWYEMLECKQISLHVKKSRLSIFKSPEKVLPDIIKISVIEKIYVYQAQ